MEDDATRTRLRDLQDRLIDLAERHAISDDTRVSVDGPVDMTVGRLRLFIYPKWEALLEATVDALEQLP